jgi:hypothetical protein
VRQRRNEAAKLPSKDRELPRAGELGLAGLGSVAMVVVLRSGPGRDERDGEFVCCTGHRGTGTKVTEE